MFCMSEKYALTFTRSVRLEPPVFLFESALGGGWWAVGPLS